MPRFGYHFDPPLETISPLNWPPIMPPSSKRRCVIRCGYLKQVSRMKRIRKRIVPLSRPMQMPTRILMPNRCGEWYTAR